MLSMLLFDNIALDRLAVIHGARGSAPKTKMGAREIKTPKK